MKILYLSQGTYPEYQGDLLFLGLRKLLGESVVDAPKISILYEETFRDNPESKRKIGWGNGFTVYGLLPSLEVDRSDIPQKIRTRFFDLIIYGCSYRSKPLLSLVLRHYPKNKIVFIDGDDANTIEKELVFRGIYFKRELAQTTHRVFPIAFAAPDSIIVQQVPEQKTRLFSICDPRDRSTYIYKDEESYYQGYQEALFGVTTQKGGWDALRHYEILANGCVPDFHNIEHCPLLTCWNLPKFELLIAQKMARTCREKQKTPNMNQYAELANMLLEYTQKNLSDVELAKYVLDTVRRHQ